MDACAKADRLAGSELVSMLIFDFAESRDIRYRIKNGRVRSITVK